jgi:pimeloyl-ACP methyl ester carboxylesterase
MTFAALAPPPLIDHNHRVGGLFVKECRPLNPTQTATPIIMTHGSGHGWWAWRVWQPFFAAAGWPTYSFSIRNHLDSDPVPDAEYLALSIHDYVDDLKSVAEWIGKPAIMMGHSLGGIVSQKAAEALEPAALVLVGSIGPAALGPQRTGPPPPMDKAVMPSREEAQRRWLHDPWPEDRFNDFYASLAPESPGVLAWSGTGRTEVDATKITCPVLCVGGAEDQTYAPKAELLAGVYGADWFEQPDAGHDMMLEAASIDTAQRINHWLTSRLGLERTPCVAAAERA